MARVKRKEHENLSATNIRKVIGLLNPGDDSKPITKKEACALLNIAYNTTRLDRIIEEFREREALIASRKAANRGKPASEVEVKQTIEDYLSGDPISEIAKRLFRSAGFVKGIIERVGIPRKPTGADEKTKVELLPDSCVAEEFRVGEIVWSAKYHRPALVKREVEGYEEKYLSKCYSIYVMEHVDASESFFPYIDKGGFFAYQLAYDLGKLEHLRKYEVNLDRL